MSSEASPADIARSYLASFALADPDLIASHVADGFLNDHTSALGSGCVGRAEYRKRLPNFLADMVALQYQVDSLVEQDGVVAVFYTMTAKWQGETQVSVRGVQRLVISGGLITHRTDYWDSAAFLIQVSEEAREALGPFGID